MKTNQIFVLLIFLILNNRSTFGNGNIYSLTEAKIVKQADSKEFIPKYVEYDDVKAYQSPSPLDLMQDLFGFNSDFSMRRISVDKFNGNEMVVRYQQVYLNIPVDNTMYNFIYRSGKLISLTGSWLSPAGSINRVNVKPIVKIDDARRTAMAATGSRNFLWENPAEEAALQQLLNDHNATYYPQGEMVIGTIDGLLDPQNMRLAYKFDISVSGPRGRYLIYIDAINGKLLSKGDAFCYTQGYGHIDPCTGTKTFETKDNGTDYTLEDETRGLGIRTYNCNNSENVSSATLVSHASTNWFGAENDALLAHFGAEKTYDYFLNKFGRNSIDGAGYPISSYIHYGDEIKRAQWDGHRVLYGDGESNTNTYVGIDIAGHEITHGLNDHTAYLGLRREPGAVLEAICDIFGTCIEWYSSCSPDWNYADDATDIDFQRTMWSPALDSKPDTYLGQHWDNWVEAVFGNDPDDMTHNEVRSHTNCYVLDFWFSTFVQGGSGVNDNGDAYNVAGINNIDAAAKIVYRALTVYLWSQADFTDFASAVLFATRDIYGCSSNEYIQCGKALYAVGLGDEITGGDFDNAGNNILDVHVYHFVEGETFIAIKNTGTLLKVSGTAGGGYNMNALNCDPGPSYSTVPGYGYLIGSQEFGSSITSVEYINGYTFVGLLDGRLAKINGTGGGGQNMFAMHATSSGFETEPGYNYLVGTDRFDGAPTQLYYTDGITFVTFNNGKILKVNGCGGTGTNLFAVYETSGGFDPVPGYSHYVGDTKCWGSVTALKKIGGQMMFCFDNGKVLKVNNTGGGGHNMFALWETGGGWISFPDYYYFAGDAVFSHEVLTIAYDGTHTLMGFGGGRILKINGNGGGGHNMFGVTETGGGFDGTGSSYYVGDAKFSGHIYTINLIDGQCFVGTSVGKVLKVNGTGGSGHNFFNVTEGSHYFSTTSSSYTTYLLGSSDLGAAVLDIDKINGTTIISLLSGKMLKVNDTGGNGDNMFAVTQEDNGFNGLPGYCYYIGSQTFDCGSLRLLSNQKEEPVSGMNVFPNPAREIVNVDFTLKEESDIKVEMIDFTGKVVSTEKYNNTSEGNNRITFSVKDVKSGFYTIRVSGDGINETQKLVIVQ